MIHGAKAWLSDTNHPNYEAAANAIERVYGERPDLTREGGSIPITSFFEDATQMNVLLLPVGACDDMAHSQNEKFNVTNLVNSVKVRMLYMCNLFIVEFKFILKFRLPSFFFNGFITRFNLNFRFLVYIYMNLLKSKDQNLLHVDVNH